MLELMNNSDKRNCCETGPSRRKNAICPFFVVAVAALSFFFFGTIVALLGMDSIMN